MKNVSDRRLAMNADADISDSFIKLLVKEVGKSQPSYDKQYVRDWLMKMPIVTTTIS